MSEARAPGQGPPMRLPQPDWLNHRLTVSGSAADLQAFRTAARGAGVIPWHLDLDGLAEDWFHRLLAPRGQQAGDQQPRSLSVAGARRLAEQLRAAVSRRHEIAVSAVGVSQACPFDLHALVPVPPEILRRGPDDPTSLGWLWEHWGTTEALRQVADLTPEAGAASTGPLVFTFWSADWTPWRALAAMAGRWPTLGFDTRPLYGNA
jgi:hypothetical protein